MADHPLFVRVADLLDAPVVGHRRLGGGDFAESYRLELLDGSLVFAKTHRAPPPNFFTTEAAGLEWLRSSGSMLVPDVLAADDGRIDDPDAPACLILEWIEESPGGRGDDGEFGAALAELHRSTSDGGIGGFGRPDGRTTGSQALPNEPCATWVEFMRDRRLLPLIEKCRVSGAVPASTLDGVEAIAGTLERWGASDESASLLHGDLWAGNRLIDDRGRSWLIDPAVHGGHREFDLAMMRLFGGFAMSAFDAYDRVSPLEDGWERRIALHQLPPLLVHALKFGGRYVHAVERAVTSLR